MEAAEAFGNLANCDRIAEPVSMAMFFDTNDLVSKATLCIWRSSPTLAGNDQSLLPPPLEYPTAPN
jgi:hypothetical protein